MQTIYINLDDSGVLSKKEKFCVYAGVVFFKEKEMTEFVGKYQGIVDSMKCNYCEQKPQGCDEECPELKSFNLYSRDNRRLFDHIKRYQTIACVIVNDKIWKDIKEDNPTRRRYTDYAIKRTIKNMIKNLIKRRKINPNEPIKIFLNMDEQTTKSSGYYCLEEGIKEELINGVYNFDYGFIHKPILFSELEVKVKYLSSEEDYFIQASDLVAGKVRRIMLYTDGDVKDVFEGIRFVSFKTILP